MRKCPVCEENVADELKFCQVCGEMLEPVVKEVAKEAAKDFILTSEIKASVIPLWLIIGAISANALIVGYWLGSMVNWESVRWQIHHIH